MAPTAPTNLSRRWEIEAAKEMNADCAQTMPCCAPTRLTCTRAAELDRNSLGERFQGVALWFEPKLHPMIRVAAEGLLHNITSSKIKRSS